MTDTNCYVYIYFRPCGTPLYVGMAQRKERWRTHQKYQTNRHLWRTLQKAKREGLECPAVIFQSGLSWGQACELEIALIALFGRQNLGQGPLVNLTDGGDGALGLLASPETRQKLSEAAMGRKHTPEAKARQSAAKLGKARSAEARAAMIAAHAARSPEDKARIGRKVSDAKRGTKQSPELKAKIAAAKAARTAEQREATVQKLRLTLANMTDAERELSSRRRSARASRKPLSEEVKLKMSAGAKASWARKKAERLRKGAATKAAKNSTLPLFEFPF